MRIIQKIYDIIYVNKYINNIKKYLIEYIK